MLYLYIWYIQMFLKGFFLSFIFYSLLIFYFGYENLLDRRVCVFICWIVIKKMEWEREDSAFMSKAIYYGVVPRKLVNKLLTSRNHNSCSSTGSHYFVNFPGTANIFRAQITSEHILRRFVSMFNCSSFVCEFVIYYIIPW